MCRRSANTVGMSLCREHLACCCLESAVQSLHKTFDVRFPSLHHTDLNAPIEITRLLADETPRRPLFCFFTLNRVGKENSFKKHRSFEKIIYQAMLRGSAVGSVPLSCTLLRGKFPLILVSLCFSTQGKKKLQHGPLAAVSHLVH